MDQKIAFSLNVKQINYKVNMYINVSKYIQTHSAKGQRKINKKDLK